MKTCLSKAFEISLDVHVFTDSLEFHEVSMSVCLFQFQNLSKNYKWWILYNIWIYLIKIQSLYKI